MILNVQWLEKAGVEAPLTLKNVYVSDLGSHVPLTLVNSMQVKIEFNEGAKRIYNIKHNPDIPVTEEMRKGIRPTWLSRNNNTEGSFGLVLVHGYCAPSNPWRNNQNDFTDAHLFLQASANMNNDEFANKIAAFASSEGLTSFSLIGFSQGGMAILHLRNYYWSGVDVPTNGRVLQSLCTPYQGNTGAGSAAIIGKVFGIGCGTNYDLSKDGAPLWLNGISTDSRKDVYFYITQFGDSPKYCNQAANMFLKKPNDGTAEVEFATLPGGNNQGSTSAQCHAENMSYMSAATDSSRNKQMNSKAAR